MSGPSAEVAWGVTVCDENVVDCRPAYKMALTMRELRNGELVADLVHGTAEDTKGVHYFAPQHNQPAFALYTVTGPRGLVDFTMTGEVWVRSPLATMTRDGRQRLPVITKLDQDALDALMEVTEQLGINWGMHADKDKPPADTPGQWDRYSSPIASAAVIEMVDIEFAPQKAGRQPLVASALDIVTAGLATVVGISQLREFDRHYPGARSEAGSRQR